MDAPTIRARLEEAVRLHLAGRSADADTRLQEVLDVAPENPDAWHLRGVLALQAGAFDQAAAHLQQAVQLNPSVPDYHFNLAGAWFSLRRWQAAADAYGRAARLHPAFREAHKGMGAALAELGRRQEAAGALRQALELDPKRADVQLLLARVLQDDGDFPGARRAIKAALQLDPWIPEAHAAMVGLCRASGDRPNLETALHNLGIAHQRAGATAPAVAALRGAVELNPGNVRAGYLLAALTGQPQASAPREYVLALFNQYASHFDAHLESLGYQVPEMLLALAQRSAGPPASTRLLDLGCGTGRCGALFRDQAAYRVGIDLAPRMIEAARATGAYHELISGDVVEVLAARADAFHLVLAADVFIYIGDLDAVFAAVKRVLAPGGRLLFSVEGLDGDGFALQPSGRFAHSAGYVERMAARHGWTVAAREPARIRMHQGRALAGELYVLAG